MSPELIRAVIKFVPAYFSWNEKRQEQYRMDIPSEDAFKIRQFLLKELFDVFVSNDDELEDAWRKMSNTQCLKINTILLPLQGIGEDLFFLNEFFRHQENLLNFKTLYDYDFDDYQFQEDSREKDHEHYERQPYRGSLYFTWARLLVNGAFSYGVLTMVAGNLYSQLEEYGEDYINKLIPHEFKPGKNHGKTEGAGYLLDFQIDAKGLEPQLDELEHRFRKHMGKVHERLMAKFEEKSEQRVFILDQSEPGDPSHHFLFTDKEILKRIRFKTFMRDCRAAEQKDHASLNRILGKEKQLSKKYLDKQYKDIIENFNPKVLRFRKKYKVIADRDSGLDELI